MADAKTRQQKDRIERGQGPMPQTDRKAECKKTEMFIPRKAFFADAMLGRLARWLRILGYDTAYEKYIQDELMTQRVLREHRWLLTRDSYLAQRKVLRGQMTLLQDDGMASQLCQLSNLQLIDLTLNADTPSRCAECNVPLEAISHDEAATRVPEFVAREHHTFARCPGCKRIFWPGSHWIRIRERLDGLKTT